MSDVEKSLMNEDVSNEGQLSAEQLEEVAGGASRWSVCPNCGQGDQIVKKFRHNNIMILYCNRCQKPIA